MIAELVKSKRKEMKLKQVELAELAGVSQANISKIESGKTNGDTDQLKRIAEVLKIDISSLVHTPEQMRENINSAVKNMNEFETVQTYNFVRFLQWDGKTV